MSHDSPGPRPIADGSPHALPDGSPDAARNALIGRVAALIDGLADSPADRPASAARDRLLVDVGRWQAANVAPYGRLVRARGVNVNEATTPAQLPAVPTDVFRVTRVAAHGAAQDARVFLTSGTTSGARGAHHLRDLSLYDRSARAAAALALFPDKTPITLINLVAAEHEAPESSLSYMVARFQTWFGAPDSEYVWRRGGLDMDRLVAALDGAVAQRRPVALLGTSFAFVYAEDALGAGPRWNLPAGSRIMQTGGFKGRTREVAPDAMRAMLASRYGVADAFIVAEYGMTELSSQLYETTLAATLGTPGAWPGAAGPRRLRPPPWLRVDVVDPDTLAPVPGDATGLVRIEDPANVDTAFAVQTSDLARRVGDGIVLLGRAGGAVPRGCSLAVEEAMGTR